MKRGPLLAVIGIGVVAVGAAGTWFYSWSKDAAEEERLAKLQQEVVAETGRSPVDVKACQALLLKLTRDPRGADEPRLIRGRVQLMMLLGKPAAQAWDVVEVLVDRTDAGPEDLLLGARILERRHWETGKTSEAFRAARLAEQHFERTGEVVSLPMAWWLSFRAGDEEGTARIATRLANDFADTASARLVAALDAFYDEYLSERKLDKVALAKLAALDRELEATPAELTIALAAVDIQGAAREEIQQGVDSLETLLRTFHSSLLGRELIAIGLFRLQTVADCEQSLFHFDWLLRNHPENRAAADWRRIRGLVQDELERLRKGPERVK
ncbi:MAG: hypothetical protein ACYTGW_08170 [Planctomycetota bacterium]|jgi:hypothetical protein